MRITGEYMQPLNTRYEKVEEPLYYIVEPKKLINMDAIDELIEKIKAKGLSYKEVIGKYAHRCEFCYGDFRVLVTLILHKNSDEPEDGIVSIFEKSYQLMSIPIVIAEITGNVDRLLEQLERFTP